MFDIVCKNAAELLSSITQTVNLDIDVAQSVIVRNERTLETLAAKKEELRQLNPSAMVSAELRSISIQYERDRRKAILALNGQPFESAAFIGRYAQNKACPLPESELLDGVKANLGEGKVVVKTPMLMDRKRRKKSNEPLIIDFDRRLKASIEHAIRSSEGFASYPFSDFRQKTITFLFAYEERDIDIVLDNDNHLLDVARKAIAQFFPGGDSPLSCDIALSSCLCKPGRNGTYIIVTPERLSRISNSSNSSKSPFCSSPTTAKMVKLEPIPTAFVKEKVYAAEALELIKRMEVALELDNKYATRIIAQASKMKEYLCNFDGFEFQFFPDFFFENICAYDVKRCRLIDNWYAEAVKFPTFLDAIYSNFDQNQDRFSLLDSPVEGVEAHLKNDILYIRTPLLGGKKWHYSSYIGLTLAEDTTPFFRHSVDGAVKKIIDDELIADLDNQNIQHPFWDFQQKIFHFLFVYNHEKDAVISNDGHRTKQILDAVKPYLPRGDTGLSCSILFSAELNAKLSEGVYLTVTKSNSGYISNREIMGFWEGLMVPKAQ